MLAAGEFEILGAWRADSGAIDGILKDMWNRGVLSIRAISIAEAKDGCSQIIPETWTATSCDAKPRVLEVLAPPAVPGVVVDEARSSAIRLALDTAEGIHTSLARDARRRAPFASADAASDFIASWLERADRRLYEVRRPTRSGAARAA
jgi:hypothetical protein